MTRRTIRSERERAWEDEQSKIKSDCQHFVILNLRLLEHKSFSF